MSEKKYLSGLYANKKHEKQPDFVVCKLKIKPQQLIDSLKEFTNVDGYLALQVKTPYEEDPNWPDKLTVAIDDQQYERSADRSIAPRTPKMDEDFDDDIPF